MNGNLSRYFVDNAYLFSLKEAMPQKKLSPYVDKKKITASYERSYVQEFIFCYLIYFQLEYLQLNLDHYAPSISKFLILFDYTI